MLNPEINPDHQGACFWQNDAVEEITLKPVDESHLDLLLPMVRTYHEFEHVDRSDEQRRLALKPLLAANQSLGRLWLIECGGNIAGYIAVCFGYSIEFGGRDAFVDEFFIKEKFRGRGIGTQVLALVKQRAAELDVLALHLEVAETNERARRLYTKAGFEFRQRLHLMSCALTR